MHLCSIDRPLLMAAGPLLNWWTVARWMDLCSVDGPLLDWWRPLIWAGPLIDLCWGLDHCSVDGPFLVAWSFAHGWDHCWTFARSMDRCWIDGPLFSRASAFCSSARRPLLGAGPLLDRWTFAQLKDRCSWLGPLLGRWTDARLMETVALSWTIARSMDLCSCLDLCWSIAGPLLHRCTFAWLIDLCSIDGPLLAGWTFAKSHTGNNRNRTLQ